LLTSENTNANQTKTITDLETEVKNSRDDYSRLFEQAQKIKNELVQRTNLTKSE
jgi:hypothetical protein